MSRSKNQVTRSKIVKFLHTYSGWYGEQCWAQHGRKFLKRLVRRTNRHTANQQLAQQLVQGD